jgi:hypothetical protein
MVTGRPVERYGAKRPAAASSRLLAGRAGPQAAGAGTWNW